MLKVAVLISGRGSNLQALMDAAQKPGYPAQIACVISNNATAPGLERAREASLPAFVLNHKDFPDRQHFDEALDKVLKEHHIQLICLAGFMRILSAWFVERWKDRLINIHPSLLPSFPGLDPHKQALAGGVKFTGCTVHFVRSEMDRGPIILQAAVPVHEDDTEEALSARVFKMEHAIYPEAVRFIAENRVNIIDERVFISDTSAPYEALINPLTIVALAKTKTTP